MPKIEVSQNALFSYIGQSFSNDELEEILPCAKGELDDVDTEEKTFKIELNDTNRPDLWSTAGLGRQIRIYTGGEIPKYDFFSSKQQSKDCGKRTIQVDEALKNIRPYIAGFAVTGKKVDDDSLKDIIQTQEKLCWNFGRKRRSIAMGVYRTDLIQYPIRYKAVNPETTTFVPLGVENEMNLKQINKDHPKGQEFGHIVENFNLFPFLTDDRGDVLSFPPVINSAQIGSVEVGDENLFIEMTGTDLKSLLLACSIVACDFADAGFTILPVKTIYPYDTKFGKEITCPYYFQEPQSAELSSAARLLGVDLTAQEALQYLKKMGVTAQADESSITINPPEYRNDFLHSVDIVEDLMIGRGMYSFEPEMPSDFTVGRLSEAEHRNRKVKSLMVGLGFQEMIFNYLGSGKDYIDKMNIDGKRVIQISNPMSENFEFVRPSIIPSLLSAESISGHAVYPHRIFEAGKIALVDNSENYGSKTINSLGFLSADTEANFNLVHSHVTGIMFYLGHAFTLEELEDPRFISGRAAKILVNNHEVGVFGEIHPQVLENWGIQVPCGACELNLDEMF